MSERPLTEAPANASNHRAVESASTGLAGRPRRGWPACTCPWFGALILCLAASSLSPGRIMGAARLVEPVRLTAGASDEMMGGTDPTGARLYYASNAKATWLVFVQDGRTGVAKPLFDLGADALAPRLGPNGRYVLFISYLNDATGDACVYDLDTGATRCLTDEQTAESQAIWLPGGNDIAVVSRRGMHGDFQLLRIPLDGGPSEVLLDRNLAAPAVSPDGRWLAFVPVTRDAEVVGANFARRATRTLTLVRLDGEGPEFVELHFDLSGASGFPAFSKDARYLYFSQYLNDTNLDGVIDGDDNSVLFRVPFDSRAGVPVDPAQVEQLTNARWNCQYPVAESDRLLATCAHEGSLDLYALPLEGSVPSSWSKERLDAEAEAARDDWKKLLILAHLLARSETPDERVHVLGRMIRTHLELREYASAEHYARRILERYADVDHGRPAAHVAILLELIAERRETDRLVQGELNLRFIQDQQRRLERLARMEDDGDPDLVAAARVVASEVHDTIGEKEEARERLEAVPIDRVTDPWVLSLYGDRAVALYRELGMTDQRLETLVALSSHPAATEALRVKSARRFVRELTRGAPVEAQVVRVARWRNQVPGDTALAMMLDAKSALLSLGPGRREAVRKALFELYRRNKVLERRRALVEMIVEQAVAQDSDYLLYEFANSWVSWLRRDSSERQYAEALYREVLLARVYVEQAAGAYAEARGYAYGLTRQTDDLEAHIAFVDNWDREGRKDVAAQYARQFKGRPDDPVYRFVQAYLVLRRLSHLEGEAFDSGVAEARRHLQAAARGLPRQVAVHHLQAFLAHLEFLRNGDTERAQEANTHYLLALDLARDNPRYRATIWLELGMLQNQVDGYRLALDAFERRDRLPFADPEQRLCLLLASARSLFHANRLDEAADRAALALTWIDDHPPLAHYRPLALARAALYHYAAGRYDAAATWYRALDEWLSRAEPTPDIQRARVQVLVGEGAVAQRLSRHQAAVAAFQRARALIDAAPEPFRIGADEPLGWRMAYGADDYRRLLDGLEAHSLEALGRLDEAASAMRRRKQAFADRFEKTDSDEDLRELAVACHHLARYAYLAGHGQAALEAVEDGWKAARRYNRRTGSEVTGISLRLLADFAELHLYGRLPRETLPLRLVPELRAAYETICVRRSPAWGTWRFLFELYLTMIEAGR